MKGSKKKSKRKPKRWDVVSVSPNSRELQEYLKKGYEPFGTAQYSHWSYMDSGIVQFYHIQLRKKVPA